LEEKTRRGWSRWIGLVLIVAALAVAFTALWPKRQDTPQRRGGVEVDRRPRSLLLITVDTTRADRLEPYGATDVATPAMQKLAERGIVFEQAYAVAPITLVAHTSILTGLYPPEHGVRNNGTHFVPEDLTTLAETLSEEGYRTGAFVSAAVLEKRYGIGQGFEFFDDDLSEGRERHPRMVPDRPAEATIDSALGWLETVEDDEDFFIWLHLYDPHASYSPPAPYRDEYRERLYDGEIAYMDAEIGRLLRQPRLRDDRDLLTVVLGDHGESLGEHGEQTHAILAYDSTLRVPLIMRWPGGPAGARIARPVSQVDLMPTVLDLFDLDVPDGISGRSWLPILEGTDDPQGRELYSETYLPYYTYGWSKLKVLRKGRWKFIDAPTPELYDLQRDPRELSNRHGQEPGTSHDMTRDLGEFLAGIEDAEQETSLELDSDALERLRSLGYLAVGSGRELDERNLPDPKNVIGLHVGLERARSLARDRLFTQAIQQVEKVLREDPNNLAALVDLAGYLERDGQIEAAISTVEKALQLDPDYSRLYLVMSGLEAARGDFEQALKLADRAVELDPRYVEAHLQRAVRLLQVNRADEVEEVLTWLLDEHPDNPQVLVSHAQLLDLGRGEFEEAEAKVRRALDRDPFMIPAWRVLGEILEVQNRSAEAAEAYQEGLNRQPDDTELHARLGLVLARTGAGSEAEMHLREAMRLSDSFRPDLHVALGSWLAERGRFTDAEKEYDKVFEVEPEHPAARNNRAIALYRRGRPGEAVAELRELVEAFPQYADAHNNLAAVAVEQQDWATAEKHARKAVELLPKAPQALNNLGLALEQTGRLDEADGIYRRAIEAEPGYWQARFNLGVLEARRERHQAAFEAFEKVLEQVPEYPEVHYQLGALYAGPLADSQLARRHLNAFLRMARPNHPWSAEARRLVSGLPPE